MFDGREDIKFMHKLHKVVLKFSSPELMQEVDHAESEP